MPDPVTTQPTSSTMHSGTSAPVQGAAGANPPAAPTPSPATIPLTPDSAYEYRDPETGQIVHTTLGDATNALREYNKLKGQLGEGFDPEKHKLYQKLEQGDPEAVRSWLEKTLPQQTPQGQPDPNDPYEKRFATMEQRLNETLEKISQIEPITSGIRDEMSVVQIGNTLKASAQEYPLLSRFPNAAHAVKQAMTALEQTVIQRGHDPKQLRQQYPDYEQRLLSTAMKNSEDQLKQMQQFFGGSHQPAPRQGPSVVNDQTVAARADQQGQGPPIVFDPQSGQFVPRSALQQPAQNGTPLPSQPVQPAIGGVPAAQQPRSGPQTADEWRQQTRDRFQSIRNAI